MWETKLQFTGNSKIWYLYKGKQPLVARKAVRDFARLNCIDVDDLKTLPDELELVGTTNVKYVNVRITVRKVKE